MRKPLNGYPRKFKLLQDVIIIDSNIKTYIVSTLNYEPTAQYLVAGIAKPILETQLKNYEIKN